MTNRALSDIAHIVRKIAYGVDLTTTEARDVLNIVGTLDSIKDFARSDGMYFLALTFGLMAKSPTVDELYGFVLSIADQSIKISCDLPPANIIDVSGTGGDKIKTFNVGTAVSFVLASDGLFLAKQATRSYTGFTGSADMFAELGMDVFHTSAADVIACLRRFGVAGFYTPSFTPTFKNRIDFLTKLKTIGLLYPTPWHLVSWIYSPVKMESRLYGIFDAKYIKALTQLLQKMGYQRAMVVHGIDGLDEISNIGATEVGELKNGGIERYTLTPEQLGVKTSSRAELQTITDYEIAALDDPATTGERRDEIRARIRRENILAFFKVLYGLDTGARRDIVLVNAGAALYLCGKVSSIREGVARAAETITSGKVKKKLREIVKYTGATGKLHEWENAIGA